MPRVSLVGDGHGGNEDYATLSLWSTAEFSVDYGGLPPEASCLGFCGDNQSVTGAVFGGLLPKIYTTGVVYDGTVGKRALLANSSRLRLYSVVELNDFKSFNISSGAPAIDFQASSNGSIIKRMHCVHTTAGSGDVVITVGDMSATVIENIEIVGGANGFDAGFSAKLPLKNCLIINSNNNGFDSSGDNGSIENVFSTNNASSDYVGVTLVNCSSGDGTGSAGLTGYTTAEMVDFAGGDYRTKSTSFLATAGSGGAFVGAFLEVSSGVTVTPNTINSVSVSNNPLIAFNSVVNVSPNSINSVSTVLNPLVSFSSSINITPNTINSVSAANNPSIDFASLLQVTPLSIDSASTTNNPVISFTSSLVISPVAINSLSSSLDPLIEFKSVINLTPNSIDSLSTANNPFITTGAVQTIGNVTSSFAIDAYSVKYKQSTITVNFK